MPENDSDIRHVSDTALMVAACRALETDRQHGLVRDPFAAELAGTRGMDILNSIQDFQILCFGVGIRSKFLDELVLEAVAKRGVRAVLCLGSGLDTRPWRLDLPSDLQWVEVDLPDMQLYKRSMMASHPPKCRLEQHTADLTERTARDEVFRFVAGQPTLMITEGLLMYLPHKAVEAIATEASSHVNYWMMDLTSTAFARRMRMNLLSKIENVRDATAPNGEQIQSLLEQNGWKTVRHLSYARDVFPAAPERIMEMRNAAAAAGITPPPPPPESDISGVHLFGRENSQ